MTVLTMIRRRIAALALIAILLGVSAPSLADVRRLVLETSKEERAVTVETVPIDGTSYVSLRALVSDAGGAFNALPTRLRVDLYGTTAWLRAGESRVHALSIFSLAHPIREIDGEAFIAFADLGDFFLKSFRVRVREMAPATPEPSAAEPPDQPSIIAPEAGAVIEPLQQAGAPPQTPARGPMRFVLIDPGHGGYNTGLEGVNGLTEKALTLAVAAEVRNLLNASETFDVALTRDKDVDIPDSRRVMAINSSQAEILISLHGGSSLSPATQGITVFYPRATDKPGWSTPAGDGRAAPQIRRAQQSEALAEALVRALSQATGAPIRGAVQAPVRILASVNVPCVMIEMGCLTHPRETERLATQAYQKQLAQGIVNGVAAFVNPSASATGAAAGGTQPPLVEGGPG